MNWIKKIQDYQPKSEQEVADQQQIMENIQRWQEQLLYRSHEAAHITCSGFILDASMEWALMVQHKIYRSVSWTGGHADGCEDFLTVALQEAREETGLSNIFPLCSDILSIEILPVPAHQKHGKLVPAHVHYNISFGLIGNRRGKLLGKEDENDGAAWYSVADLHQVCNEKHMLPIYDKLIARMQQIATKQRAVFSKLPSMLLPWYAENARDLPWRKDRDPYHVWISEIMLQQTRVEAVKDYYKRFVAAFPNINTLAESEKDQVQKLWEGLGYYTRARNLQLAAKTIVRDYQGIFPTTYEAVRNLPGIGDYTAGAICSICYDLPTPAVDGNVLRVVMRITDCYYEIDSVAVKRAIGIVLSEFYPKGQCGTFTQSLMELGAVICVPNGAPQCRCCPLASVCRSHLYGNPEALPVRKEKRKRVLERRSVFILQCGDKYALRRRESEGLLADMWEYPNVLNWMTEQSAISQVEKWACKPVELERVVRKKHIFTHIEWHMLGFYIICQNESPLFQWKTAEEIQAEISLPTAFRMFWNDSESKQ